MKFNCKPKLGKPIRNINNIFDFVVKDLDNNDVNLSDYKVKLFILSSAYCMNTKC